MNMLDSWLQERNIVLEENFTSSLRRLAVTYKTHQIKTLNDVYKLIGCNKTDISRWKRRPMSTHASSKRHKIRVINSAKELFPLTAAEAEALANKAGLSLAMRENVLAPYLRTCGKKVRREIYCTVVSERMLELYIAGREPTKEILIALVILLGLDNKNFRFILKKYGYALSLSLPNDAIVLWFLRNSTQKGIFLLYDMNCTLEMLGLPLLIAKSKSDK